MPRVAVVSEQIRPLELSADLPARELYALELSRALARLGAPTDLFVRRLDATDARITEVEPGLRLVTVPAGPPGPRQRRTLWMLAPQMRDQMLRFMVAEGVRYDVVHGTTWTAGIAAADVAKRAGIPHTQLIQAPNASKHHHLDDPSSSPPQRVQFEQDFAREAAALVARTASEREHLVRAYGADPGRVSVIPWGIDLQRFQPGDRSQARRRLGLDQTGSIVLHVGRTHARCGVHDLLRALALLDDLPGGAPLLLLVGGETREPDPAEAPELGELWQLAAELGVADRVRFVGRRGRGELQDYYAAADVVAYVPWHEPYGLQIREALACGRPVVGTAVGGIADALADEQAGSLVAPEDPRDLAVKLRRLLRSPGLRARLGRAGRAYAEHELGWYAVARAHLDLFGRVAGITAAAPPAPRLPAGAPSRPEPPPA
jgi:glycosyltransferase involved in cell wall biosynthesis